jgi:hypothetical protein
MNVKGIKPDGRLAATGGEARSKVFCLGFHRTGTTTFQTALERLGYRVIGMRDSDWSAYETGDLERIRQAVREHDAFRDMPWPLLYEWLEGIYPAARFVLTLRETGSWLRSCEATYKARPHRMFRRIYGFDHFAGNEERAREVYEAHIAAVRDHFADRPDRFLEIDFTAGEGWEKLCTFLDEPVPGSPFPHANAGEFTLVGKARRKLLKWFRPAEYRRRVRDR